MAFDDLGDSVASLAASVVRLLERLDKAEGRYKDAEEARLSAENHAAHARAEADRLSKAYQSAEEAVKTRTTMAETYREELKQVRADWERDVQRLTEERNKAEELASKTQQFKEYVHETLDKWGIDKEPPGEHFTAGCRVGQRLAVVRAVIDGANERAESYLQSANRAHKEKDEALGKLDNALHENKNLVVQSLRLEEQLKERLATTPPEFLQPRGLSKLRGVKPKQKKPWDGTAESGGKD